MCCVNTGFWGEESGVAADRNPARASAGFRYSKHGYLSIWAFLLRWAFPDSFFGVFFFLRCFLLSSFLLQFPIILTCQACISHNRHLYKYLCYWGIVWLEDVFLIYSRHLNDLNWYVLNTVEKLRNSLLKWDISSAVQRASHGTEMKVHIRFSPLLFSLSSLFLLSLSLSLSLFSNARFSHPLIFYLLLSSPFSL